MNGYDAYSTYLSMRLHFTSDYDFFRYYGKSRTSEETFNSRKDKYSFHKLARMYSQQEFVSLLAVLFCHRDKIYTSDMFGPEAERLFAEDKEWKGKWKQNFTNELETIKDFASAIKRKDDSYPELLTLSFQKEISYNSISILEKNLGILSLWNKKLSGDFVWDSYYKKLNKYSPFVFYGANAVDETGSRIVLLEYLKNNKTK